MTILPTTFILTKRTTISDEIVFTTVLQRHYSKQTQTYATGRYAAPESPGRAGIDDGADWLVRILPRAIAPHFFFVCAEHRYLVEVKGKRSNRDLKSQTVYWSHSGEGDSLETIWTRPICPVLTKLFLCLFWVTIRQKLPRNLFDFKQQEEIHIYSIVHSKELADILGAFTGTRTAL